MKKSTSNKSYKILDNAFKRKVLNNPSYSKNRFAKDLKVSAAFVTQILSGKRQIPFERLKDIFTFLELDIFERQLVLKLMVRELAGNEVFENFVFNSKSGIEERQSVGSVKSGLLSHWWNIVVLEGLSIDSGRIEIDVLQNKIGISSYQMSEALKLLLKLGLIENVNGRYRKIECHSYIPTGKSRIEIRNFHKQMIQKAEHELMTKAADEDFHKRLITGFTFAMNPNLIETAKTRILNFLNDLGIEMSNENTTEVYQCNVQFFPMTNGIKK